MEWKRWGHWLYLQAIWLQSYSPAWHHEYLQGQIDRQGTGQGTWSAERRDRLCHWEPVFRYKQEWDNRYNICNRAEDCWFSEYEKYSRRRNTDIGRTCYMLYCPRYATKRISHHPVGYVYSWRDRIWKAWYSQSAWNWSYTGECRDNSEEQGCRCWCPRYPEIQEWWEGEKIPDDRRNKRLLLYRESGHEGTVKETEMRQLPHPCCCQLGNSSGCGTFGHDEGVYIQVPQSRQIQIYSPCNEGTAWRDLWCYGIPGGCAQGLSSFCRTRPVRCRHTQTCHEWQIPVKTGDAAYRRQVLLKLPWERVRWWDYQGSVEADWVFCRLFIFKGAFRIICGWKLSEPLPESPFPPWIHGCRYQQLRRLL